MSESTTDEAGARRMLRCLAARVRRARECSSRCDRQLSIEHGAAISGTGTGTGTGLRKPIYTTLWGSPLLVGPKLSELMSRALRS